MKLCSKCKQELPLTEFTLRWKNKKARNSWCKECVRGKQIASFHKDPIQRKRVLWNNKKTRKGNRQFLINFLKEHPCNICGEDDIRCLEFDHIEPTTKFKPVSALVPYSRDRIVEEISKCRVLCANCHRKHTADQFERYKELLV